MADYWLGFGNGVSAAILLVATACVVLNVLGYLPLWRKTRRTRPVQHVDQAYLVAELDTATLRVCHVAVYSEPAWHLTQVGTKRASLQLFEATGSDFADARRTVLSSLSIPWLRWAIPLLGDGERREFERLVAEGSRSEVKT